MTIGELLKDYRIQQKKTQRQWANDVVSPSFYAKVEKNLSSISADNLIELLNVNKISLTDFFDKLNHQAKTVHDENLEIDRMVNEAYYQNSVHDLQQIRNFVAESDFPNKKDKLDIIDIFIAIINKNLSSIDSGVIDRLKERTFDVSHFNSDSLRLYCNLMSFYNLDSNLLISKRVIRQFIGSSSIDIQKLVLSIIINIL